MKQLGAATNAILGSAESRRNSGPGNLPAKRIDETNLPEAYVPEVDRDLPRVLWSACTVNGSPRAIRRALVQSERDALARRVGELEPALAPYASPAEDDDVALAISDMFGGFRGMRQQGGDAIGTIDSVMRLLKSFPVWAIKATCERVRLEGYEVRDKDGVRREKHWPPADAELADEVKKTVRLRTDALASARALLAAPIETQ